LRKPAPRLGESQRRGKLGCSVAHAKVGTWGNDWEVALIPRNTKNLLLERERRAKGRNRSGPATGIDGPNKEEARLHLREAEREKKGRIPERGVRPWNRTEGRGRRNSDALTFQPLTRRERRKGRAGIHDGVRR